MKIDFVKTLEASSPYIPGRIYFEESTSLIKVATASNQYRVFGGVRSADWDEENQILTIQNGNGDEVYLDMSVFAKKDEIDNSAIYVVHVTVNGDPVQDGIIHDASTDHYYSDIADAYSNGKVLIADFNGLLLPHIYINDSTHEVQFGTTVANLSVLVTIGNNQATYMAIPTAETDPVFSSSPASQISSSDIISWNNKVSNVQADWNETTGLAAILNKPTITTDASVSGWGYLKANDVSTKVDKSDAISTLSLNMNSSTYVLTLSGTMADGSTFTVGNPVDLPLETMVVDGSYNSTTKQIVLGLKSGSTVEFSVADLVSGLQSEITSSNKLSADLIQDGTTNKVVTATDKNNWNSLVSNVQADWNATSGLAAILNKPTIPSTLDQIADGSTRKLSDYLPLTGGTMNEEAEIVIPHYYNGDIITSNTLSSTGVALINGDSEGCFGATYLILQDSYNGVAQHVVDLRPSGLSLYDNLSDYESGFGTYYQKDKITKQISNSVTYELTIPNKNGTLAVTSDIPTDASVSGWGYIKTVTDASIAALGYTKNTGTLTGVKFNNVAATINGTVAEITATIPPEVTESTVSGWGFTKNTGTLTEHATHKLTATNNNATATSGTITFVESLTGTNTATSGDLTITATRKSVTIPAAPGTLKTNNNTAQTTSASEALSGTINLHKVAKTGTYSDLIGLPTIPAAANNATISIQKGGTAVDSFTVDASSNKTINIPNELPTVTSSDNGKILEVVNGVWAAASPITVYSGSNTPNNSTGINGDIYIQS